MDGAPPVPKKTLRNAIGNTSIELSYKDFVQDPSRRQGGEPAYLAIEGKGLLKVRRVAMSRTVRVLTPIAEISGRADQYGSGSDASSSTYTATFGQSLGQSNLY
jgi:hypothetical protein